MNMIELASSTARAENARRISLIELEVGALAGVMSEALEFCFAAASRNTLAEGARLKINTIPAQGKCLACDIVLQVYSFASQCPQCGQYLLHITKGDDLRITAVTIDDEE